MNWALVFARLAAGGVLGLSGVSKLVSPPEEFAFALEAYRALPFEWLLPFARVLPWVEVAAGALLVAGLWTRPMALMAAGMYAMFIVALSQARVRGIELTDCGCFGKMGPHFSFGQAVIFDAALLICSLLVSRRSPRVFSLDVLLAKNKHPAH